MPSLNSTWNLLFSRRCLILEGGFAPAQYRWMDRVSMLHRIYPSKKWKRQRMKSMSFKRSALELSHYLLLHWDRIMSIPYINNSKQLYMAHARHRIKLVRKAGVIPSGACSTMLCPFCMTLATPGMHWVHHCPKCRVTALRDDCGRGIGLLTDTRVLIRYREGRKRWVMGQQQQDESNEPGSSSANPFLIS
jgi:hypothetical protein